MVRLYDKTTEIVVHQKEWFRDIWRHEGWDGKEDVIRCEFQCRRKFLREMGVDDFASLKERLADIWRYCTHDWLRICNKGSKTNQSRWEEKDYWKLIQGSYGMFGQAYGVLRMKVKDVKHEHLMTQLRGVLVSACALRALEFGIDGARLMALLDLKDMVKSQDFRDDVIKRQASLSNVTKTNNYLLDEALLAGAELEAVEYYP